MSHTEQQTEASSPAGACSDCHALFADRPRTCFLELEEGEMKEIR